MTRPLVSVCAVALALVLVAGACGGDGAASPETETPVSTPLPTSTMTPAAPPSPGPVPPKSVDLAAVASLLTAVTRDPGDMQPGGSALAAGDFNDDGIADLLIGAPYADGPDNSREDAGEAYIIFGRPDLDGEVSLAAEEVGLIVHGALAGDTLGFGVAAGDLNDDGIDDAIVGAPASNGLENIRTDTGEVYVIFGSPSLRGSIDIAAVDQDVTLRAAEGFARVGSALAVADVNGDGVDDLIAGAPFGGREPGTPPGGPRTTVGEVYVAFGDSDLGRVIDVALDQQDFTLAGVREQDRFGQSVAAGDVNADGFADIVVGAPGYDGPEEGRADAGRASVFFGSRGLTGKRGAGDADISAYGADPGDGLGDDVASGDFDGDGLADLLLVSRLAEGPDERREAGGEAYLLLNLQGLRSVDLAADSSDVIIYGADAGDMFAVSVAVTDIDADGKDDAAFGVPLSGALGNTRELGGEAYVLFGEDLGAAIDLQRNLDRYVYLSGADPGDRLGSDIVLADLTGDGRLELVASAPGPPPPEARPGKVYVIKLPER